MSLISVQQKESCFPSQQGFAMPTFESRPFSSRVVGAGDSKIHNCITKGNGTVCTQKKMKAIDEMACNQCLAFCKGSSLRAPNNLEIPAHCFAYQIHSYIRA